jgi:hypothetical protein
MSRICAGRYGAMDRLSKMARFSTPEQAPFSVFPAEVAIGFLFGLFWVKMGLARGWPFEEGGIDEKDLEEASDVHCRGRNGNVTLFPCPTAREEIASSTVPSGRSGWDGP